MHTARAGHVHLICPATHFVSRLQVNHLDTWGINLVDRLLWACAIVVASAEGYKVHVPRWGALNIRGILQVDNFSARFTKLGIMVYLHKIIKTSCEETA